MQLHGMMIPCDFPLLCELRMYFQLALMVKCLHTMLCLRVNYSQSQIPAEALDTYTSLLRLMSTPAHVGVHAHIHATETHTQQGFHPPQMLLEWGGVGKARLSTFFGYGRGNPAPFLSKLGGRGNFVIVHIW